MRSSTSRGPYPPQLVRKPREKEINRAFTGWRRRKGVYASQGGRSARLRCAVSAAATSASTLLRVAACVRKHGQATTSRWHRRQPQHARCDGRGLPVGIQGWRARWLGTHAPDAQEVYASEHAGGNVHREVPEQPSQYRAPPYWTDPATPSSPPLTGLCRFPQQHCLQLSHFPGSAYKVQTSFLVHISLLELVFTSGHIYTSPPTATYHAGGRWLCQVINAHRQLPMNQQVFSKRLKFLAIICSRIILTIGFLVFSLVVLYIVSRRIGLLILQRKLADARDQAQYQLKTSWKKYRRDLLKQMLLPSMMNCDFTFIHCLYMSLHPEASLPLRVLIS
ncbi:hypothetical protein TRIUR3_25412 [Triticum urartu]|uniref:Uncharacterized protein n=1 Tax=Triticum urartu TaxID=4572 RepID=M7YZI4_TRIUA|nr:hypothetical protein TRIUR3_25412 [Triticum urartu]